MNFYLMGIIFFSIVFIVCSIILIYFMKDEKNLQEVSDNDLMKFGKTYTKGEFEEKLFNQYVNILESIQYSNYSFLKDVVSDNIYNQMLVTIKNNQDNNVKDVITDIKKEFSKLISFETVNDLEIAKLWIRYSSIEYVKGVRKVIDENNNEIDSEVVVKGDKNNPISHEYILTFVKGRTQIEDVVCPTCGFQTHMLTSSKCIRCDSEIVPKKMHWVFVEKVTTSISKQK